MRAHVNWPPTALCASHHIPSLNLLRHAWHQIMAPPLLTKLDDAKEPGLQIIVTAFDGFLYVIDGHTGAPKKQICAAVGWAGERGGFLFVADGQWGRLRLRGGSEQVDDNMLSARSLTASACACH